MAKRNAEAMRQWLTEHMPKDFFEDFPAEQVECFTQMLVFGTQFEEYVYLNTLPASAVISLHRPDADLAILKHHGTKGIREYTSYVSDANFVDYELPLRITRIAFTTQTDPSDKVMPEEIRTELYESALQKDSVQYRFLEGDKSTTLVFAWRNVPKFNFLYYIAQLCKRHNLKITSLQFRYIEPLSIKSVLIGSLVLTGQNIKDDRMRLGFMREFEMQKLRREIPELEKLVADEVLTGNQAMLISAISSFCEQLLTHVNSSLYTEDAAQEAFGFHPELTTKVVNLFRLKFHPKKHNIEKYIAERELLIKNLQDLDTGKKKHDDRRRTIFQVAVVFVDAILKTNMYEHHKLGMAFRMTGDFLDKVPGLDRKSLFPELPYGIFYIKSWNYIGFQIRFRELSRGGMRTVISRDLEHLKYERANAFTECYNLAFTQQMKNKDIPEGGSKSLLFLLPFFEIDKSAQIVERELKFEQKTTEEINAEIEKYKKSQTLEYMYYNQRCFCNTLLSLLVWDDESNKLKYGNIIDYLGKKEFVYLGPDENMHDCIIDWLAAESRRLEYKPILGAFISGKDGAGMNHKEFGVTSFGVLQYVKTCVEYLQLPQNFTVKISGGPDGDVAGNMILLLAKHYPESKLLTITDGFGACYDPEGLDYSKLCEMFHKTEAINKYPPSLLHDGAWLLCLWETRQHTPLIKETRLYRKIDGKIVEEWIPSSQAMHMFAHNAHEHYADIFVPGGGRPRTLTMANVEDFIVDGKPTAQAMCEGANLYITGDAREYLEDKGLMIFKDSSANKCGVISSSYEILGGLVLDDETYIRVKPEFAQNVLAKLEKVAYAEAQVMLRYWLDHNKKIRLSSVSKMVSDAINKFTDQIIVYLEDKDLSKPDNKKFLDTYLNYIPEVLKKENMNAVINIVPDYHKKCIIATSIACKLVYERGIDWEPSIVDLLPIM